VTCDKFVRTYCNYCICNNDIINCWCINKAPTLLYCSGWRDYKSVLGCSKNWVDCLFWPTIDKCRVVSIQLCKSFLQDGNPNTTILHFWEERSCVTGVSWDVVINPQANWGSKHIEIQIVKSIRVNVGFLSFCSEYPFNLVWIFCNSRDRSHDPAISNFALYNVVIRGLTTYSIKGVASIGSEKVRDAKPFQQWTCRICIQISSRAGEHICPLDGVD